MFGFKKKGPIDWNKRPLKKFDIYFGPENPVSVIGHEHRLIENNHYTQISNCEAPGNAWIYRNGEIIATFQRVLGIVVNDNPS